MTVKLQTLRCDFENFEMKRDEYVQTYLLRVSSLVLQMKSSGESISNEIVVGKVLETLTRKFDHIVAAIEEAIELSTYSFAEFMSSLQAHEEQLLRPKET